MLHLLPLLALAGALASPLEKRQDVSASISAVASATAATDSLSVPTSATAVVSGTSASVSAIAPVTSVPAGTSTGAGNSSNAAPPSVTMYPDTSAGEPVIVNGQKSPLIPGVDTYLGVPFAAPPVGDLRFTPPQSPIYNSTIDASAQPPACLQSPSALAGSDYSEDCLYLNVFTPQGANAQTAFLPVMVWIHGGSFTGGGAALYDGSGIVATSTAGEKPVIVVVVQYRLGILGFGYGDEIAENGAANLGLKDQIKALEWVKQNIWAWGGDPERVTVTGESAGAISIALMYLQQDIDLFRGAIMQSGAASTAPIGPTSSSWQQPYDLVVSLLGCDNSTESSFECLKAAPADALLQAQEAATNATGGAFIFAPSIDGDLIPSSPHGLLESGQFARIPFIAGNVKDEGTLFTPQSINNETAIIGLILALEPSPPPLEILIEAISLYPADPSEGSPFGTGNETFGLEPSYKRAAAILGDAQFQSQRRWQLQQATNYGLDKTWAYQFEQTPPTDLFPAARGVSHGSDVLYTFGAPIIGILANWTGGDAVISAQMIDYWTSFVNYLDPSEGLALPNATAWPAYGGDDERNMLRLQAGNVTVFPDTYRMEMEYFTSQPEAFNMKKRE